MLSYKIKGEKNPNEINRKISQRWRNGIKACMHSR